MSHTWQRVVVKVGTNVLTDHKGSIDDDILDRLTQQIALLKNDGIEVVLVSSGAVGAGRSIIDLPDHLSPVTKRQVLASIGQIELMKKYQTLFHSQQLHCAQVLTTKEDFRDRQHYVNMKTCLLALLRDNIVPIVNENDVISINELMFTDNDELAGLLASLVDADHLIILSNVDGVYRLGNQQEVIKEIKHDDNSAAEHVLRGKSSFGRGGMITKLQLCQKVAALGIQTYIANGKTDNVLENLRAGKVISTRFIPNKERSSIKKWIAHADLTAVPKVLINDGAREVLCDQEVVASLLPVGIVRYEGSFEKGDLISICNLQGDEIGIGLAAYNAIALEACLGKKGQKPLVHYDYLLLHR